MIVVRIGNPPCVGCRLWHQSGVIREGNIMSDLGFEIVDADVNGFVAEFVSGLRVTFSSSGQVDAEGPDETDVKYVTYPDEFHSAVETARRFADFMDAYASGENGSEESYSDVFNPLWDGMRDCLTEFSEFVDFFGRAE